MNNKEEKYTPAQDAKHSTAMLRTTGNPTFVFYIALHISLSLHLFLAPDTGIYTPDCPRSKEQAYKTCEDDYWFPKTSQERIVISNNQFSVSEVVDDIDCGEFNCGTAYCVHECFME